MAREYIEQRNGGYFVGGTRVSLALSRSDPGVLSKNVH